MEWEWQGRAWDALGCRHSPWNALEIVLWGGTALAAPSVGAEHPNPTSRQPWSTHTGAPCMETTPNPEKGNKNPAPGQSCSITHNDFCSDPAPTARRGTTD